MCPQSSVASTSQSTPFSQKTILATSTLEEDKVLKAEAKKCNAEFCQEMQTTLLRDIHVLIILNWMDL